MAANTDQSFVKYNKDEITCHDQGNNRIATLFHN